MLAIARAALRTDVIGDLHRYLETLLREVQHDLLKGFREVPGCGRRTGVVWRVLHDVDRDHGGAVAQQGPRTGERPRRVL